ncbi:MAG: hypothetical protein ORN54_13300 [Cyclobacteriaceae bacterium]|nr:hypothetical protein [Cyclobacteriaceae bacterium]
MYFTGFDAPQSAELNKALLWEYDTTQIDYDAMRIVIVQRVVERGRMEDWYFILKQYGIEKIKETIKGLSYLNRKDMRFVSHQFSIPLNEMKCYERKQLTNRHWDS